MSARRCAPSGKRLEHLRALRLIYIVDLDAAADGERLRDLIRGGVTAVWLRAPKATGAQLYARARPLRDLTRTLEAALLIGDRVDVAQAVGADGVQLGHRAPPFEALRDGYAGWIGTSCHTAEDLERAARGAADHAVLSPVFAVPGKGAPLGVDGFGALRSTVDLPVVALGGIHGAHAGLLRAAGADGVAAIRALRDATDAGRAARDFHASNGSTG